MSCDGSEGGTRRVDQVDSKTPVLAKITWPTWPIWPTRKKSAKTWQQTHSVDLVDLVDTLPPRSPPSRQVETVVSVETVISQMVARIDEAYAYSRPWCDPRRKNSASIARFTAGLSRHQSGPIKKSGGASPLIRSMTIVGGKSSRKSTTVCT